MSVAEVRRGTGRPAGGGYKLSDGTRVPSVTTVLGRFKESGGLIGWAWKMGRDGISLDEARDSATSIGTTVHHMVEAEIHGEDVEAVCAAESLDDEHAAKARKSWESWRDWCEMCRLVIEATEVPMVSESMRTGGTLDAVALVGGRPAILDWKTSNAAYVDHVVQLAAYAQMWREQSGETDLRACHLLRFSKSGSFHHHHFPDVGPALEMWRTLRLAYDLDKKVKGLL